MLLSSFPAFLAPVPLMLAVRKSINCLNCMRSLESTLTAFLFYSPTDAQYLFPQLFCGKICPLRTFFAIENKLADLTVFLFPLPPMKKTHTHSCIFSSSVQYHHLGFNAYWNPDNASINTSSIRWLALHRSVRRRWFERCGSRTMGTLQTLPVTILSNTSKPCLL